MFNLNIVTGVSILVTAWRAGMYGLIVFDHDGLICWFAAWMASGYVLKA